MKRLANVWVVLAAGMCPCIIAEKLVLAACVKECQHFKHVVANTNTDDFDGTYCLELNDGTRGGNVYWESGGQPSKTNPQHDDCDVYMPTDCSGPCVEFNPRITSPPDMYAMRCGTAKIWRYKCSDEDYD